MTGDAQRVIRAVAVPRLDADGLGVHLAWSGPDLIPLASKGYEVRRRARRAEKKTVTCASLDSTRLASLVQLGVLFDELGLLRAGDYSPSAAVTSAPTAPDPDPLSAGGGAAVTFGGQQIPARAPAAASASAVGPGPADLGGATPTASAAGAGAMTASVRSYLSALSTVTATGNRLRVFTQELTTPSDAVSVQADGTFALAVAISAGKAVGASVVGAGTSFPAPHIDTVVIYALGITYLQICAQYPLPSTEPFSS